MTDALMREIERVIFEAHPLSDRDGAVDFDELLEMRTTRFREACDREEDALADLSERIGTELEKEKTRRRFQEANRRKGEADRRIYEGPVEPGRERQRSEGPAACRAQCGGRESSGVSSLLRYPRAVAPVPHRRGEQSSRSPGARGVEAVARAAQGERPQTRGMDRVPFGLQR